MKYAIEVEGLTKKYSRFTLKNVSMKIPYGCIMGFVGENGAGKSTTIKGILNLIRRDEGVIRIFGKTIEESEASIKEDIGVVFDSCVFPEALKVKELEKVLRNVYKNWEKEKFPEYLEKFKIDKEKKIKELSRGMKMKLSLAAALSHKAKLLILDEATGGLDPVIRDQILDILLEFIQDEEHSVLVSSHITSDLEKVADYITFIHDGKIIFAESKDELLEKYAIIRCTKEEYQGLDEKHTVGVRKNRFGYELLVDNRLELERKPHSYVIDPATIEEIILFQSKEGAA